MTRMIKGITGDPATTDLRSLITNLLTFIAALSGVFFLVSDTLLSLEWVHIAFDFGLMGLFGTLYGFSRFRRFTRPAAHVGAVAGLAFYTANFFVNAGIVGPTLMVMLMILTFVTVLHGPKVGLAYVLAGVALAVVCLVLQKVTPGLISPYLNEEVRYWDVTFTFLFCLGMLLLVMRLIMQFFEQILELNRAAQAATLQTEKLAALGQLVANIGHEISNPVGVMGTALGVSQEWWRSDLPRAAPLLEGLSPERTAAFWRFLRDGVGAGDQSVVDSRTARSLRPGLTRQLEAAGHPNPARAADDLLTLQLTVWDPAWSPVLAGDDGAEAFDFAIRSLFLDRANRNASRAYQKIENLVQALRSYSRSGPAERVPTAVAEGLETVLTLYTPRLRSSVDLVKEYSPVPVILARPDELIQVWTNLIQNALQAMGNKGTLTLSLSCDETWVVVTVADTGPGVPDALKQRIFLPFFTTKAPGEGTGLGLGIVKRIVTDHSGTVEVDDAPGGGARFTVKLPVQTRESA